MARRARGGTGSAPGGGRPPLGGRPEPGADSGARGEARGGSGGLGVASRKPGRKKSKRGRSGKASKRRVRSYTPEERRAAVEAYQRSGLSLKAFSAVWGVSGATLSNWVKRYREEGPKGLERRPHASKGTSRLAAAVKAEIVRAGKLFPAFGLRRVRDYLRRFRGVQVSPGSISKTLASEGVPPAPGTPAPKRKSRPGPLVRFERARPGSLWQSDITSFVLPRHGQRVYLTVFLDDFSRYVVSSGLSLHQKQGLVMEALLEGIERFGKPEEVLTDQGRQYFAWRGKSGFQKLLEKQGIRHVVSRSHHPQTLGKCERLWRTIQEEFWSRVQPQELSDARRRLAHFLTHYNHHRPHQGIGGLVPADRFFGAESEVRAAVERRIQENELQLALGEPLRRPVYLVGQIGERSVSLHGEQGRLVISAPGGEVEELEAERLGMAQEGDDERADEARGAGAAGGADAGGRGADRGRAGGEPGGAGCAPGASGVLPAGAGGAEAPCAASSPAGELSAAAEGAGAGAGAMGVGDGGGAGAGARGLGGHPGAVAGPGVAPGGGGAPCDPAAAGVAAVAAGAVGDGGGPAEAAEAPGEGGAPGGPSVAAAEADRAAGAGEGEPGEPGGSAAGPAGAAGGAEGEGEGCRGEADESAEGGQGESASRESSAERSGDTSWPRERGSGSVRW